MTEGYDCINDYIGKETYSYNAWGQLVNYNNDVGETASYTYYSDGLRASKTIGDNTTKYYYDGDNVINETLNNNNYATNVMGVNGYVSRRQNGTTGYLFKDAHGDVLSIYTSTSNKAADYTYDAWGEIQTKNESSSFENNPLRYYGQYYDYESGMTYLRARYYDSSIKRFITEDPAKDGSNWYAYCGNNPVMMFDPSGLAIYVPENRNEIQEYLKLLTRDEIYIDSSGYVQISKYNLNANEKSVGTELIYRLISDKVNTCTIKIGDSNGATPSNIDFASKSGVGSNVEVTFKSDYLKQDVVPVLAENGEIINERQAVQIALGHELVHALRTMNGNRKRNQTGSYLYYDNGYKVRQEELDTIGIDHIRQDGTYANASEWYFTENSLRAEQGFCKRIRH